MLMVLLGDGYLCDQKLEWTEWTSKKGYTHNNWLNDWMILKDVSTSIRIQNIQDPNSTNKKESNPFFVWYVFSNQVLTEGYCLTPFYDASALTE